jgi:hypothetical protein
MGGRRREAIGEGKGGRGCRGGLTAMGIEIGLAINSICGGGGFRVWKAAARSAISTWADHRTITTSQHRSAISTWAVHRTITTAGGSPASQRARLLLWLVSSSAPRLRRSSPSPTATAGSLSRPTDAVSGESICETPAPRTPCRPPRRRWPSLSRLQPLHMNFHTGVCYICTEALLNFRR